MISKVSDIIWHYLISNSNAMKKKLCFFEFYWLFCFTVSFNFIHISSLDKDQKNVEELIEGFIIANKETACTLTIVGGSPERVNQLKVFTSSLNGENCISFIGTKTEQQLSEILKEHNLVYKKSQPKVVLEKTYFDELQNRINETDHLQTFKGLIKLLNEIKSKE